MMPPMPQTKPSSEPVTSSPAGASVSTCPKFGTTITAQISGKITMATVA